MGNDPGYFERKGMPVIVNGNPIKYDTVPVKYMATGMQRYIEQGIPPGSFMQALLKNDLKAAIALADDNNAKTLIKWVQWMRNNLPASSWGSADDYKYWILKCQKERDEL